MTINRVNITLTKTQLKSRWTLRPYNPINKIWAAPEYLVPAFRMKVDGVAKPFEVIRFGLQRRNRRPIPLRRKCDAGLFRRHRYQVKRWLPNYNPQSHPGTGVPGAVVITGNFYIHEGATFTYDPWGTYGCVEVVGKGEWRRFLSSLTQIGGADVPDIIAAGKMTVSVEGSAGCRAQLKVRDRSVRHALGKALSRSLRRKQGYELLHDDVIKIIRSTYTEKRRRSRSVSTQEWNDLYEIKWGYTMESRSRKLIEDFLDDPRKRI